MKKEGSKGEIGREEDRKGGERMKEREGEMEGSKYRELKSGGGV